MTCLLLHSSGYSSVFLGAAGDARDAALSCFKVYNKDYPLQPRHWLNIWREVDLLTFLQEERVDGVVQLLSVADTSKHFSLQFKACLGGNLYQCLERRECCQEQELCTKVVIPLLHVLANLHSRGIIHRDIKPENIFFEADGKLTLGDFGLAIDSKKDKPCSRVGTQDYMAPEVLGQPSADTVALGNIPTSALTAYSTAVDIWALGNLVHEALIGKLPFYHRDPAVASLKAQFGRADRLPAAVSPDCQAFVDAVLQKQPGKRPSAAELLQHPWVRGHAPAAAAVVAARVKAKVLAELRIDRPPVSSAPSSAQASPAAACGPNSKHCYSGTTPHQACPAPAASATLKPSCPIPRVVARDASDSTSSASTTSSRLPHGHPSSSYSSQGSSLGDAVAAPAAAPVMRADGVAACGQAMQAQHEPAAAGGCLGGAGTALSACAVRQRQHHQWVSSPGLVPAGGAGCHQPAGSGPAAGGAAAGDSSSGGGVQHNKPKQLHLLPALSDPVLANCAGCQVTPNSAASAAADQREGLSCCCCRSPGRSSQSGTCSAAVEAATASTPHPCSWRLTGVAAPTAGAHKQRTVQPCAEDGASSAPAHTQDLQQALSGDHQPRSLGTLSGSSSNSHVRRVVQLGAASTAVAPAIVAGAAAAASRAAGHQNPLLVKSSGMAAPAPAPRGAASPKPMLFSPPKPAALVQRLRSFAHGSRDAGGGSSGTWRRRHSFDLTGDVVAAAAAVSSASGSSDPAASRDQALAAAAPELPAPARPRARPAAPGLASPLAALCKLWSPVASSAGHGLSSCSTAPCCDAPAGQGREAQVGAMPAQPGTGDGEPAGTAALLVGLDLPQAPPLRTHQDGVRALVSPLGGYRTGKRVCMKMFNQALGHQQHA